MMRNPAGRLWRIPMGLSRLGPINVRRSFISAWDIGFLKALALFRMLLMIRTFHSMEPLDWGVIRAWGWVFEAVFIGEGVPFSGVQGFCWGRMAPLGDDCISSDRGHVEKEGIFGEFGENFCHPSTWNLSWLPVRVLRNIMVDQGLCWKCR